MFGGLAFLRGGRMFVGIVGDRLPARARDAAAGLLSSLKEPRPSAPV